jgi:hypothetical protein
VNSTRDAQERAYARFAITTSKKSSAAAAEKCASVSITRPKPCFCDGKQQRRLPNSSGGTKKNYIYLRGRGAAGGLGERINKARRCCAGIQQCGLGCV